jgi:hypothetical protein
MARYVHVEISRRSSTCTGDELLKKFFAKMKERVRLWLCRGCLIGAAADLDGTCGQCEAATKAWEAQKRLDDWIISLANQLKNYDRPKKVCLVPTSHEPGMLTVLCAD